MTDREPSPLGRLRATAARAAFGVIVLCAATTACGNGDETAASTSTSTTAEVTTTESPTTSAVGARDEVEATAETAGPGLAAQYGQRYCEVLSVTASDEGTSAEVWGTQGLNDCPQDRFDALDPPAIAADLGADLAVLNGPRYWTLDRIVADELAGSLQTRDFGGIEMRSIATVELGEGVADRTPLTENSVARDTTFVFEEGRQIHELTAPDRSVYVMQSYSIEVDPSLTAETLPSLGDRLDLPEGWTFTSRVLDEELMVEDIDGIATVVQDQFRNTYQLRSRN